MADGSPKLLPGFRFHPTDEEIITNYLVPKTVNPSYITSVMGEVDLNNVEHGDLPSKAKMGDKEWYFFCHQGKKYPTGTRVDRSTKDGFWKATGKDRDIFNAEKVLVGKRKTLVFYTGRAPGGVKTKWVMKEFSIEGSPYPNLPSQNEWVVSKVCFKGPIDERERMKSIVQQLVPDWATMPSLMDVSNFNPVESQVSHNGPMTLGGREKMTSIVEEPVPVTVTMSSLMNASELKSNETKISHKGLMMTDGTEMVQSMMHQLVPDWFSMPAPMDFPNFNSGNSGCPESSWVNVVEDNFNYLNRSYAYGATVHPQIYDPNVDGEDLEWIRALSVFDTGLAHEIGRHNNGEQLWNQEMTVYTLQNAGGTSRDCNMDDWWMLKENEMGCYDVGDRDDPKKI